MAITTTETETESPKAGRPQLGQDSINEEISDMILIHVLPKAESLLNPPTDCLQLLGRVARRIQEPIRADNREGFTIKCFPYLKHVIVFRCRPTLTKGASVEIGRAHV